MEVAKEVKGELEWAKIGVVKNISIPKEIKVYE
jgi:hypothetical protein